MTIRTAIIQRAKRMLNEIGVAEDLDPDEAAEAMTAFQAMLLSTVSIGMGGPLTPVLISADYTAGEDEEITDTSGTATITKPTTITESDGEVRAPRNGAAIQINKASGAEVWLYVAYLASWKRLTGLTQNDASPLGPAHDEGLAAMLAVRIAGPNTAIPVNVALMAEKGMNDIYIRFQPDLEVTLDEAFRRRRRWTY